MPSEFTINSPLPSSLSPLPYRKPGMSIRRISFLFMRYIFKDNTQAA